jgi:hypothetical protein
MEVSTNQTIRSMYNLLIIYFIAFVKILNEMRLGILSEDAIRIFKSLSRIPGGNDNIEPTEL